MPLELELEPEFQSQDFEAERGMRVLLVKTFETRSSCVCFLLLPRVRLEPGFVQWCGGSRRSIRGVRAGAFIPTPRLEERLWAGSEFLVREIGSAFILAVYGRPPLMLLDYSDLLENNL